MVNFQAHRKLQIIPVLNSETLTQAVAGQIDSKENVYTSRPLGRHLDRISFTLAPILPYVLIFPLSISGIKPVLLAYA